MGMRSSDATFLRREVLPLLFRLGGIVPEAAAVADKVAERLHEEDRDPQAVLSFDLNRWHQLTTQTGDDAGWFVSLVVEGCEVPYITGVYYDEGPYAGHLTLTLDGRFGIDTNIEQAEMWAPFLAHAMAVAAGRTSHGAQSYLRNPHGRSGGGDPPVLGELMSEQEIPAGP